MRLSHGEFVRRFSQHILPKRFVRIRHYGILSSSWKRGKLKQVQAKMTARQTAPVVQATENAISHKGRCPCCKKYTLEMVCTFKSRGPPAYWLKKIQAYKKRKAHQNTQAT